MNFNQPRGEEKQFTYFYKPTGINKLSVPFLEVKKFYYNTLLNLHTEKQPPLTIEYSFEKAIGNIHIEYYIIYTSFKRKNIHLSGFQVFVSKDHKQHHHLKKNKNKN